MKGYKKRRTLIKGSAFKTFVDSLPKVKNSTNVQIFLGLARNIFYLKLSIPTYEYAKMDIKVQ